MMMATYRTPSDGEALGPAVRILLKRVMSDPALGAASRTVMCWLLLEGRDEAPSAADMGRFVGLTERSARRAYAELKETGWLDPQRGWSEAPRADTPERSAVLEGGRTELSATLDLPSFRDHIAMLEVIRDRALAKGNEVAALSAQTRIGRALGYDRPQRNGAARNVRHDLSPPSATAGGGLGGGGNAVIDRANPSPPPPRPSPELTLEGGRQELATTGAERDPAGADLAETGSNWHELAGLGLAENQAIPEKLKHFSDLLEKPIFAAEKEHADPSRRPSWLNGVSAAVLASGQNCPPPPSILATNPALSATPPLL